MARAEPPRLSELPRAEPGTPLYVHLPFCAAKCHYCDFFSVAAEGQDVDGTLDAILLEIEARAPEHPRTVFLGGGTPSLLDEAQLTRVLGRIEAVTGFRGSAREVTAECNPESLDVAKAARLLELGVQRLSIGFQSLRPETLELFGRVHAVEDSFRAFEAAREAGCEHVNVDLIFASPGQTPEAWLADLERVLALGPDHVSAYNLTFEEETRFRKWLEDGRLQRLDEELELELFLATRETLIRHGYEAYEISNFARNGEPCEHNRNYWRNGPYVGIGPSAASRVGPRRFGNVRALPAYVRHLARGETAEGWSEELEPLARLGETWWLGLRLAEGLSAAEARDRARFPEATPDPAPAVARRLVEAGLLEVVGERFRLAPAGLPLADAVAREFLSIATEGDATRAGPAT